MRMLGSLGRPRAAESKIHRVFSLKKGSDPPKNASSPEIQKEAHSSLRAATLGSRAFWVATLGARAYCKRMTRKRKLEAPRETYTTTTQNNARNRKRKTILIIDRSNKKNNNYE